MDGVRPGPNIVLRAHLKTLLMQLESHTHINYWVWHVCRHNSVNIRWQLREELIDKIQKWRIVVSPLLKFLIDRRDPDEWVLVYSFITELTRHRLSRLESSAKSKLEEGRRHVLTYVLLEHGARPSSTWLHYVAGSSTRHENGICGLDLFIYLFYILLCISWWKYSSIPVSLSNTLPPWQVFQSWLAHLAKSEKGRMEDARVRKDMGYEWEIISSSICHTRVTLMSLRTWTDMSKRYIVSVSSRTINQVKIQVGMTCTAVLHPPFSSLVRGARAHHQKLQCWGTGSTTVHKQSSLQRGDLAVALRRG